MAAIADNPITPDTKAKYRILRRSLIALVVVVVLAIASVVGWRAYRHIRQERIANRARVLFDKKDYGQALIAAQWALRVNPRDLSANRMMADLADIGGSPQVVFWRRAVAELEPGVVDNYLKWAESALRHNSLAMAEQALANVDEADRKTASFHGMAARLAQAQNQPAQAEAHFGEAAKLEPQNEEYQFGLASARLESPDAATRDQARAAIEQFKERPEYRRVAHRVLIQDYFRRSQWKDGFLLAAELQATADAAFEDRMLLLDLLRKFKRSELHAYLMDVQTIAADNPEHVAIVLTWLNRNTMALVAADWSTRLPEEIRARNPVPAAIAESYANLRDWGRLKGLVTEGNWEDAEFMRIALLARVQREEGDQLASRNQWTNAINAAKGRPEALEQLARFATSSKWEAESTDLLWQVARGPRNQMWALMDLFRLYTGRGETRGLLNVSVRILEIDPKNLVAQNNVASLSLLLGSNMDRAQALAQDAYRKQPENPGIAATYAYALHLQGKTDEGLKVMRLLPAKVLEHPAYAAYYGVLLVDSAEPEEAEKFLDLARAENLLPAEQTLVASARERLRRRVTDSTVSPKR